MQTSVSEDKDLCDISISPVSKTRYTLSVYRSAWPWWHFLMHIIPGFFVDVLLRLVGKKPM